MKKVLLVYADSFSDGILPIGISMLVAVLKDHFNLKLFDTTFYPGKFTEIRKWREKTLEYKPLDKELYTLNTTNLYEDFYETYLRFNPDLVAISATSSDYQLGLSLLKGVDCPVIFGGIHATIAPNDIITHPKVTHLFRGEAENIIVDLFNDIIDGKDLSTYPGLWYKDGIKIIKNLEVPIIEDLDTLPCPDWSLFDKRHFLRPFQGKPYCLGTFELSRGCPYHCLVEDTIITTENSKESIQDIQIGNIIKGFNFEKNKLDNTVVNELHKRKDNIYRITLEDSTELNATDEHPVFTKRGWIKVKDLTKNDIIFKA